MARLLIDPSRVASWTFAALVSAMLVLTIPARAEAPVSPPNTSTPSSDKVQTLLQLLEDPEVRAALAKRDAIPGRSRPSTATPDTMAGDLGDELQAFRSHIGMLAAEAPRLPEEFATARAMLSAAVGQREMIELAFFLAAFVALGFGSEYLYHRAMTRSRRWLFALHLDTARERISAVFARLAYGLGIITSYALGSVGAVLMFDWSHLLKEILLGYLIASVAVRLAFVFGRFFLAPAAERFRVLPVANDQARFLFFRLGAAAVLLAFGSQTISLLGSFGFSAAARELTGYALGIALLALLVEVIWRYPDHAPDLDAALAERRRHRLVGSKLGLSAALVLLWVLYILGAGMTFWILAFALGLPAVIAVAQMSTRHILRPPGATIAEDLDSRRLEVIFVERGIRSALIVLGALLLGHLLGLDIASLTMEDTVATRIVRGVLGVVIVVLVADFLWHAVAALIDRKLAMSIGTETGAEASSHAARLQTLLPILKNVTLALVAVIAFMMVLAAIGIQIGPLIASAGVVGVAIGFGAQTLVKDIISGVFYLVDDAFRIGEYIQSGSYKGTVESFSLRSVKLRHQRGALYTVPFGILGAVQNQSRDWVVDKISINVPYETDLDVVRKLIKRIGEALAEDPELGPDIIKPIKMQGVANFGDYAIQIQTKMMTKPGDVQFAARRRALVMIKQAFDANGIGFALPMVHVSGGDGRDVAGAAQRGLSLVQGGKADAAV